MTGKANIASFVAALVCFILACLAGFGHLTPMFIKTIGVNPWFVVLFGSLVSLAFGVIGLSGGVNFISRLRGVLTVVITSGLSLFSTGVIVIGAFAYLGTYVYSVKANWGVSLPKPDSETTIMSTRGGIQGDGNAITKLKYRSQSDINQIKSLSPSWMNAKTFAIEEKSYPNQIQNVITHVYTTAKYFYLSKPSLSNYIVFELKGHTLTVYESYL
ncbi:hypothetical protein [Alicyclobacillus sp. SO9]|uniref:hypothetical protein n=1 Tax=Alicyclobacillus sp. SO9 TaxID=2665646 RepID=UPI0018E7AA8D|nr:hypothetical protein [Alicyclobacillus sp. SO9]QQE78580.1 hypothetical protein GI364_22410 [Alicyclobacillus sp. SO9]